MKPINSWIALVLMLGFLTACGGNEETQEEAVTTDPAEIEDQEDLEEEEQIEENEEPAAESDLHAEEIMSRTTEVMTDVESYAMDMSMVQDMDFQGESMSITTNTSSEIMLDPLRYYENTIMQSDEEGMEEIEAQTYYGEEGLFLKDSVEDQWFKLPDDFRDSVNELAQHYESPEEQLELLIQFEENIEVSQADGEYILEVSGDSEQLKQLALEMTGMLEGDISTMVDQLFAMMEIEHLEYTLFIDEETFYQTGMTMDMEMTMNLEGDDSFTTSQQMEATYSNYNEIEEIEIPEDVVENAEELNFEELGSIQDMEETDLDDLDIDQSELENGDTDQDVDDNEDDEEENDEE
ncbi:DUF6612 family protein [Thalassorhabdus alkalitolerans]|uniref:DUF6612 family protein n=1 Tax=Thalassorhabdus alkalitolerans TaxID=2282697 RepID=A0ABW0YIY5_9BACI